MIKFILFSLVSIAACLTSDEIKYGRVCYNNIEQCDYRWDEELPLMDRFANYTMFSLDLFDIISEEKNFN